MTAASKTRKPTTGRVIARIKVNWTVDTTEGGYVVVVMLSPAVTFEVSFEAIVELSTTVAFAKGSVPVALAVELSAKLLLLPVVAFKIVELSIGVVPLDVALELAIWRNLRYGRSIHVHST